MEIKSEKKEIVKQLTFAVKLENEEEINAFRNLLVIVNADMYRRITEYKFKLERSILEKLQNLINEKI